MAATMAQADDAAIKQEILGYWKSGRHAYLYKNDGIAYMMGGTSNLKWDVRDGMYYEGSVDGAEGSPKPLKIISLTKTRFTVKWEDGTLYTLKRITKAEAEEYGKPGELYQ